MNTKNKIKVSKKTKKYIIAEVIIAIFMVLFLIVSRIFNLDDSLVLMILEGCSLLTFIIFIIIIFKVSK